MVIIILRLKNLIDMYFFLVGPAGSGKSTIGKKFNRLKIKPEWIIKAPFQHVEYKSLTFLGKIKYVLKTIKYDFQNLNKL